MWFHANERNMVALRLAGHKDNRNVGTCWAKSLTGFKLYPKSANKCQYCCGSMQTDATSHNIVAPNNVGSCWSTMHRRPKLTVCILYGTSGASDL